MLTKSDFQRFLTCKNEFWLDHHFPEEKSEPSLEYQLRREAGYEVEGLARTLAAFKDRNDVTVDFGTEFQTDALYAKADIVLTDNVTGEIEIYEVKSGTKAKQEYQIDLTFQCVVAEKAGFNVRKGHLIFLDNSYVFNGELDVQSLLTSSDETEFISQNKGPIEQQIEIATAALDEAEPAASLNGYCKANKLGCRFILRHYPDIPEYNVSNLFNAGSKKLNSLLTDSILKITDIPADFDMTDREAAIVAVERSGQPSIDSATIRGEIDNLEFPLNFLDYESFNPAVPKFTSIHPYQQMVFQYSLHTMDELGGEIRHTYHLSRNDGRHPTEEIVERLYEDLNGRVGTIIIWSEGFETKRNTEMGEMFPDYVPLMNELNENVYDLRKVFSRRLYMHPGFRGRDSIKKVLPVITGLSYEGMDIADGVTASIKWYHAATGRGTLEERNKTFQDLEAYCHLDTLAMVEIYRHLLTI
jgi:CRISPR/Cas system-associated exonuclease Cas4 (RecB family)